MLSKFAPGQVWKYATRDEESNSRITIARIDDDDEYGNIVHIYISDLRIPNLSAPDGFTHFISHMPFAEEALEQSVTSLEVERADIPNYEDGYKLWRQAFENNEAGVFEVSVVEGIEFVQYSLRTG